MVRPRFADVVHRERPAEGGVQSVLVGPATIRLEAKLERDHGRSQHRELDSLGQTEARRSLPGSGIRGHLDVVTETGGIHIDLGKIES
jgi:hypothetical protein